MGTLTDRPGFFDDEQLPRTPREERIARAREKEHARLALGSLAHSGYYIFDEIITDDAGICDFLAVGPTGVTAIILRFEVGYVSRGATQEQLLVDGETLEDDPYRQAQDLVEEIEHTVFDDLGEVFSIACFPWAQFELDEERRPPPGTTAVWELPRSVNSERYEQKLNSADIEEIAEKVQEVYGRPPIVTPRIDEEWKGGT